MSDDAFQELEIDESNLGALKKIVRGVEAVALKNTSGREVDARELVERLATVSGIGSITSLVITPTSRLKDLTIVRAFPNLENIQVNGGHIQSLDGLESFGKGRYVNIDTGKNRRRNIAAVGRAPIVKLSLQFARSEDLDAIAACRALTHLELGASPNLPFGAWSRTPLSTVVLSKGAFEAVADADAVPTLRELVLTNCRKLEAFKGDNGNLTWLVVQGCGRLRLDTLATCSGVESLFVVGERSQVSLSVFLGMVRLQELSLENCKTQVDVQALKAKLPKLTKLHAADLDKKQVVGLSEANPGVLVSGRGGSYKNGAPQD